MTDVELNLKCLEFTILSGVKGEREIMKAALNFREFANSKPDECLEDIRRKCIK